LSDQDIAWLHWLGQGHEVVRRGEQKRTRGAILTVDDAAALAQAIALALRDASNRAAGGGSAS